MNLAKTSFLVASCLMALIISGCLNNSRKSLTLQETHSDSIPVVLPEEGQIRVIICEAILTNTLKLTPGSLIFAKLTKSERDMLTLRFQSQVVLPDNQARYSHKSGIVHKTKERRGLLLQVDWVEISGQTARAQASCTSGGTIKYEFEMSKRSEWKVEKMWDSMVIDHR